MVSTEKFNETISRKGYLAMGEGKLLLKPEKDGKTMPVKNTDLDLIILLKKIVDTESSCNNFW